MLKASRTDGTSPVPPPPKLKQAYTWEYTTTSRIRGVLMNSDQGQQSVIALEQDSDGIDWSIAANNIEDQQTAAYCRHLRKPECRRHRILRKSAHPRVPVEPARYYRKQARSIVPQGTAISAVQRFVRCADSNCREALQCSGRQRMANSSYTADANSSLGSWKRAHRVPSLGRL